MIAREVSLNHRRRLSDGLRRPILWAAGVDGRLTQHDPLSRTVFLAIGCAVAIIALLAAMSGNHVARVLSSGAVSGGIFTQDAATKLAEVTSEFRLAVVGASQEIGRSRDPSGRVTEHMVLEAATHLGNSARAVAQLRQSTLGAVMVGVGGSGLVAALTTSSPNWILASAALLLTGGSYLLGRAFR